MLNDHAALIFESIPIAVFAIDTDHAVTLWNQACENLLGFSAREMLGTKRPWIAFYNRERPVMADLIIDKASQKQIAKHYSEFKRSNSIDGAYEGVDFFPKIGRAGKWIYFTAAPIQDIDGRILGSIETLQDITHQRQLEEKLRKKRLKLSEKTHYLESVNQTLKSIIDQRAVEKRALEENMIVNLKRFVMPNLEKIRRCSIDSDAKTYLNVIETNLTQFLAPQSKTMFAQYLQLTPTQVEVANLIREGKNTKEIGAMMNISPSSVQWHRKNIRSKLGLTNGKVNLCTYLQSLRTE